jgi:crossover junction endodeoxyribonuclease RusA
MRWIALELPPSGNNLFMTAGRRRILAPRYREWRDRAVGAVLAASVGERIRGPYAMHIQAGRPDNRKRDLDNLLKAVGDALVRGGAVADDSDCQAIEAKWVSGIEGIRVLVLPTAKVPA